MPTVAFVHQKGGTGKSTLSISLAWALAQAGHSVLLLDTDYQGTASERGNRHGYTTGVETRSMVQPIVHRELARFRPNFEWIVIDGPPSLSPMTESILRASDHVVVPTRPSQPDVWALPWLAAIITKLREEGQELKARVVFNQYAGEDLHPLREEIEAWHMEPHPEPMPADPAFREVFSGHPLPGPLAESVLDLVAFT
jgi:chromosome partitioning protein